MQILFFIGIAIQYPVLAPVFAVELVCEIRIMLDFVANAISSLSGVDPEYISNILSGTVNVPFTPPLDCITNNLIVMRTKIANLRNSFVPQIQLLAIPSSGLLTEFHIKFTLFIFKFISSQYKYLLSCIFWFGKLCVFNVYFDWF